MTSHMVWLISDLHLGHDNIIAYENRPFINIFEMESAIKKNWASCVTKVDKVFILGDVAIHKSKQQVKEYIEGLPGYKTLIMGNHDLCHSVSWWHDVGFDAVSPYPIILDDFYMLSHKPLYLNSSMPYVNIHGHIHSKKIEGAKYVNVSVEQIEYKPVSFDEIKGKFNIDKVGAKDELHTMVRSE